MTDANNTACHAAHAAQAVEEARARCDELRDANRELVERDIRWRITSGSESPDELRSRLREAREILVCDETHSFLARLREVVQTLAESQAMHDAVWDAVGGVREGESLVDAVRRVVSRTGMQKPKRVEVGQWWVCCYEDYGTWCPFRVTRMNERAAFGRSLAGVEHSGILDAMLRDPRWRYLGSGERPVDTGAVSMSEEAMMGDGMGHANECVTSATPSGALPKPPRVEVGQRWRFDARDIDGVLMDYAVEAATESAVRLVGERGRVRYAKPAEMLTSLRWSFLGSAPAPQRPGPQHEPSEADADAPAADVPSEPTARDAVAGMLLRFGYSYYAESLLDGSDTPDDIASGIKMQTSTLESVRSACIAALEALARGDLRGARDHVDLLAAIERLTQERDAFQMATEEGSEIAACLRLDIEGLTIERDEARAEAAALRAECDREVRLSLANAACDEMRGKLDALRAEVETLRRIRDMVDRCWDALGEQREPLYDGELDRAVRGLLATLASVPLANASTDTSRLTDDECAVLGRVGWREEHGKWIHLTSGAAFDPSRPHGLTLLRDAVAATQRFSGKTPTAAAGEDTGEAVRRRAAETAGAGDSVAREGAAARRPEVGDMVLLRVNKGAHPCVVIHVWNDGLVNLRDLFDLDEVESAKHGDGVREWRFRH